MKLVAQEWATYLASTRKAPAERGFDMAILSWGTADPDSGMRIVLHSASIPPAGSNVRSGEGRDGPEARPPGGQGRPCRHGRRLVLRAREG